MLRSLSAALLAAALLPAGAQASERIAYSRFTSDFGALHIASVDPDGGNPRQLTRAGRGVYDFDPQISPDGSRIVFERDFADGSSKLVLIDADGGPEQVVDTGCSDPCFGDVAPTWTANGKRIAYTRVLGPFDGPGESAASAVLYTVKADGSDRRRLSRAGIDGRFEDYSAHFGDGYVQFLRINNATGHSALFRMAPDATGVSQLTPWRLDADIGDLANDTAVFETYGTLAQASNVATVPVHCGTPRECAQQIHFVTHNPPDGRVISTNPSWSPDGTRIVMAQWTNPSSDEAGDGIFDALYTLNPDGSDQTLITATDRWSMRPSWGTTGS